MSAHFWSEKLEGQICLPPKYWRGKYQVFIVSISRHRKRVMKIKAPAWAGMAATPLACMGDTDSPVDSESGFTRTLWSPFLYFYLYSYMYLLSGFLLLFTNCAARMSHSGRPVAWPSSSACCSWFEAKLTSSRDVLVSADPRMSLETLRKEADTHGGQISALYMQLFSTSTVKMNMEHADSLPGIFVTNILMGVNPTCCWSWNVDPLMPSGYIRVTDKAPAALWLSCRFYQTCTFHV